MTQLIEDTRPTPQVASPEEIEAHLAELRREEESRLVARTSQKKPNGSSDSANNQAQLFELLSRGEYYDEFLYDGLDEPPSIRDIFAVATELGIVIDEQEGEMAYQYAVDFAEEEAFGICESHMLDGLDTMLYVVGRGNIEDNQTKEA